MRVLRSDAWGGRLRPIVYLLLLLFAVLSAVGGPLPAQAVPQPALLDVQRVTRIGRLAVITGHTLPDSRHRTAFVLVDAQGAATNLAIDEALLGPLGGPEGVDGRQVEVTGAPSDGTTITVTAIALVNDQPEGVTASPSEPGASVTGSQPYVTILCRFADAPSITPRELSYFAGLMSNTRPGLDHFYREISYNNINLLGSEIHGWYNLPQPRSYYFTQDPPDFQRMINDCTALADAEVYFPNFTGINLVFNQNTGCCAWGGSIVTTLDGVTKSWPATWMPPGGFTQSMWAHEMGHALGLGHSANAVGTTYQNPWDVMSKDRYNCAAATDPTYGCIGQGTISYHKDLLGWIPPANKLTASTVGRYSISLSDLDKPPVEGRYLMAQIPIPGGATFYTIEARRRAGYDSKLSNDAVIIHTINRARIDDAWLVDADGNGDGGDAGAQWLVGETFTDPTNGISVAVTGAASNGFNVTITRTSGTCLDDAAPTDYESDNGPPEARLVNVDSIERHSFCTANDQDWVKFEARGGWSYRVETLDMSSPTDTVLELYAPDGTTLLASNDNGGVGPGSLVDFDPPAPGTYFIRARQVDGGMAGSYDLRIISTPPPPPASLDAAGSPQRAMVNTAFALPLAVTVRDAADNPLPWVTVNFSAPGSGPSATLSAVTATTDANGRAGVTATAGRAVGSFDVTASVVAPGGPITATFRLTNTPGAIAELSLSGQQQQAQVTTDFASPLTLTVRDAFDNPIPDVTVRFIVPSDGASATLSASTAVTNANGQVSITATAGQIVGSYDVLAIVNGPDGPITSPFRLTNTARAAVTHRVYIAMLRR